MLESRAGRFYWIGQTHAKEHGGRRSGLKRRDRGVWRDRINQQHLDYVGERWNSFSNPSPQEILSLASGSTGQINAMSRFAP
jgi:hypothetical protein